MQGIYSTDENIQLKTTKTSFFRLCKKIWRGKHCSSAPLHRFFSLMRKMNARSYIEENLEIKDELLEEKEMAVLRCKPDVVISAKRLSFFSKNTNVNWSDPKELPDDHLLGYAVIVELTLSNNSIRTYLLEAVTQINGISLNLHPPDEKIDEKDKSYFFFPVPNYYYHNICRHQTSIGTDPKNSRNFTIYGAFYAQQNDLTSVCAHAALRMAVNNSTDCSTKLPSNKITNKYINDTLELDFSCDEKMLGHYEDDVESPKVRRGLYCEDIEAVVEKFGSDLSVINFDQTQAADFDQFMYSMVESCFPTILEVQGWNIRKAEYYAHVMTVLGHTLNSDRWEPQAEIGYGNFPLKAYMPSSSWVCHYIMNDDNFGTNVTLPSAMLRNDMVPRKNPKLHAQRLMCITPKIKINGYQAEQIAMNIAKGLIEKVKVSQNWYWLEKLKERNSDNALVARTIFIKKRDYLSFLREQINEKRILPTEEQIQYIKSSPSKLWVTEISIPNLYIGNKSKLGDVVINPCASNKSYENNECFLFAWFPAFFRPGLNGKSTLWYQNEYLPLLPTGADSFLSW